MTVADMLKSLGYDAPGIDLDDTLKWVLVELHIRRTEGSRPFYTWATRHQSPEYQAAMKRAREDLAREDATSRRIDRLRKAALRYRGAARVWKEALVSHEAALAFHEDAADAAVHFSERAQACSMCLAERDKWKAMFETQRKAAEAIAITAGCLPPPWSPSEE